MFCNITGKLFHAEGPFSGLRSGGFGKRLFAGIVFGLAFFLMQRLAVNLASVYSYDLRLAFAVPPLLVLGLSWLLFHRRSHA